MHGDAFAHEPARSADLRPADMVPGTPARNGHPATAASYPPSNAADDEEDFHPSM